MNPSPLEDVIRVEVYALRSQHPDLLARLQRMPLTRRVPGDPARRDLTVRGTAEVLRLHDSGASYRKITAKLRVGGQDVRLVLKVDREMAATPEPAWVEAVRSALRPSWSARAADEE